MYQAKSAWNWEENIGRLRDEETSEDIDEKINRWRGSENLSRKSAQNEFRGGGRSNLHVWNLIHRGWGNQLSTSKRPSHQVYKEGYHCPFSFSPVREHINSLVSPQFIGIFHIYEAVEYIFLWWLTNFSINSWINRNYVDTKGRPITVACMHYVELSANKFSQPLYLTASCWFSIIIMRVEPCLIEMETKWWDN